MFALCFGALSPSEKSGDGDYGGCGAWGHVEEARGEGGTVCSEALGWGGKGGGGGGADGDWRRGSMVGGAVGGGFVVGMVTVSMDRGLGIWQLGVGGGGGGSTGVGAEVRVMVPTLGGYPYDIDISAWDPYRVAGKLSNVRIQ